MSRGELFLLLGVALTVLGTVRLLLTRDVVRQVLALNVASSGVLLVLLAVAHRADPEQPDPVLHALALTGIVITVSVTGLALGLAWRIEAAEEAADGAEQAREQDEGGRP